MKSVLFVAFLLSSITVSAFETRLNNKIYVANEEAGTISVIDVGLNSIIKNIDTIKSQGPNATMYMAHNVQVAPDSKTVWVTAIVMSEGEGHGGGHGEEQKEEYSVWSVDKGQGHNKFDEVIVIDAATDKILKRIPLGEDLHLAHVVLDETSQYAYITATDGDEVIQVDAKAFKVVGKYRLSQGAGPHGARICAGKLFVAGKNGKNLGVIDLNSGAITEIPVGGVAIQTACLKDGSAAFVSLYDTKEIVRFDTKSGDLKRVKLPAESQGPAQITITADGSKLLVADQGMLMDRPSSNLVYEMDPSTLRVQGTFKVGEGAHGIAISKSGEFAFVTSQGDSKVTMIDLTTKQVVREILVGKKPNGISILD